MGIGHGDEIFAAAIVGAVVLTVEGRTNLLTLAAPYCEGKCHEMPSSGHLVTHAVPISNAPTIPPSGVRGWFPIALTPPSLLAAPA